jgi:hypothetical protein
MSGVIANTGSQSIAPNEEHTKYLCDLHSGEMLQQVFAKSVDMLKQETLSRMMKGGSWSLAGTANATVKKTMRDAAVWWQNQSLAAKLQMCQQNPVRKSMVMGYDTYTVTGYNRTILLYPAMMKQFNAEMWTYHLPNKPEPALCILLGLRIEDQCQPNYAVSIVWEENTQIIDKHERSSKQPSRPPSTHQVQNKALHAFDVLSVEEYSTRVSSLVESMILQIWKSNARAKSASKRRLSKSPVETKVSDDPTPKKSKRSQTNGGAKATTGSTEPLAEQNLPTTQTSTGKKNHGKKSKTTNSGRTPKRQKSKATNSGRVSQGENPSFFGNTERHPGKEQVNENKKAKQYATRLCQNT